MKKVVIFILVLGILMMVGCAKKADEVFASDDVGVFTGSIESLEESEAIILVDDEQAIRSSGDKVRIHLSGDLLRTAKVGSRVKVTYDGDILESYPLQVNIVSVEIIE